MSHKACLEFESFLLGQTEAIPKIMKLNLVARSFTDDASHFSRSFVMTALMVFPVWVFVPNPYQAEIHHISFSSETEIRLLI